MGITRRSRATARAGTGIIARPGRPSPTNNWSVSDQALDHPRATRGHTSSNLRRYASAPKTDPALALALIRAVIGLYPTTSRINTSQRTHQSDETRDHPRRTRAPT